MPDLSVREVTKTFPGVLAVDRISLDFHAGEIHAILGENGAGKSTLMHLLSGLYRPDSGSILLNGQPHTFSSPRTALAAGIAMVHQHFMLIPSFTIAQNILLALPAPAPARIDYKSFSQQVKTLAAQYAINIESPDTPVSALSVGSQQRVEILKALAVSARVLILDEPTAVLTPAEVENLFLVLRRLKQEGYAILLITHKIPEVLSIADRLSVLRRGRLVATKETALTTSEELTQLMIGDLSAPTTHSDLSHKLRGLSTSVALSSLLSLTAVSTAAQPGGIPLHNISLTLKSGEILGIAGVDGNGQTELIELLLGFHQPTQGSIVIQGLPLTEPAPSHVRASGVSLIPQDRRREGLALSLSVEENLLLNAQQLSTLTSSVFLTPNHVRKFAQQQIETFGIRTASPTEPVSALSGGNQQRVVIARELATKPKIIIAANPTRGLDIGATDYVHHTLIDHCQRGAGVILVSTDLDEIFALSHRIYVLYQGHLLGPIDSSSGHQTVGQMMTGVLTTAALSNDHP